MTDYAHLYVLAQMANGCYDTPAREVQGWVVIDEYTNVHSGFSACAYQEVSNGVSKDGSSGQVVIAYRGTDDFMHGDGMADFKLRLDAPTWHAQFTDAMAYARSVRKAHLSARLSVTGHSLGGALAQIAAQAYGLSGATFDAAGAAQNVLAPEFGAWTQAHGLRGGRGVAADFVNFIVVNSEVSHLSGPHLGQVLEFSSVAMCNLHSAVMGTTQRWLRQLVEYAYENFQSHTMNCIELTFANAAATGVLPEPLESPAATGTTGTIDSTGATGTIDVVEKNDT